MSDVLAWKLEEARRRYRWVHAATGVLRVFVLLTVLFLAGFHLDRLVVFTSSGRVFWLAVMVLAASAAAVWVALGVARSVPQEALALQVERAYPTLQERLLTAVELAPAGALAGASPHLAGLVIREAEQASTSLDFARAVDTAPLRRWTGIAACAGVLLLGYSLVAPGALLTWARRILFPAADIPVYAHTRVWVLPAGGVAARGDPVVLGVRVTGREVAQARLHYRFEAGPWNSVVLRAPGPQELPHPSWQVFQFPLGPATQTVTYYATAGDGQSNPHTLRVEDRPTILGLHLRVRYPAYTRLAAQEINSSSGNLVVPTGTEVTVQASANKPLKEARLVEDGRVTRLWDVRGSTATGTLHVSHDETYSLRLVDQNNFTGKDPPVYTLRAVRDRPPVVRILQPGGDIERTPWGRVGLKVSASDDYGVSSLGLVYHVGRQNGGFPLASGGSRQVTAGGVWSLARLKVKPGDTVEYFAQARDNDAVDGFQIGRSSALHIRIVGVEEMRGRLDAQEVQEREALRQLIAAQKNTRAALAAAAQHPGNAAATTRAEAAQRSVAQATGDLAARMAATTQQMDENGVASSARLQQRRQAAQALSSLAHERMPSAAAAAGRREFSSAAQQEKQIQSDLEALAAELAPPPALAQLAAEADRLALEQQSQADASAAEAERSQGTPQSIERNRTAAMALRQQELARRTRSLVGALERAARSAADQQSPDAASLGEAARQMTQSGVSSAQAQAQQNLSAGRPAEAVPHQQSAADALRSVANNLDRAAERQASGNLAARAERLEAASERLLQMANEERAMSHQAQSASDASTAQRLAQQQTALMARAHQMEPDLRDAPAAGNAMRNAQQNMQQAHGQLSRGAPRQAVPSMSQATTQLLRAAKEAMDASQELKEQQAAREAMHKAADLAREQRMVMRQTTQVQKARGREPLTPELQQKTQQIARTQQQLVDRGRALRDEMPSQGFQLALDQAVNRMNEAARALDQQNTGQDTQRDQEHAAQTLERIARALGQMAQAGQQETQGSSRQGGPDENLAAASGSLALAREMEAQIREETAGLDRRRDANPERRLTAQQQRELNWLTQGQRETRRLTDEASQLLKGSPDIGRLVQEAGESMADVEDLLRRQATGSGTQGKQDRILGMLQQALQQTRQAMREQMQQSRQSAQRPGAQQSANRPGGNQPAARTYAPVVQAESADFGQVSMRGRGFGGLPPRAQQALREGLHERVPPEYRDLVNEYYKALSEKAR
ncbi:MAG: DUF4175 family protein [Chthonomonadales bacterium]